MRRRRPFAEMRKVNEHNLRDGGFFWGKPAAAMATI